MRLRGKGSVAHGPGLEVPYDLRGRLHFLERHRITRRHEFQQSAKRVRPPRVVHQVRVGPEPLVRVLPHCSLQRHDGLGAVHVVLFVPAAPQIVEADRVQCLIHAQSQRIKGVVVPEGHAFFDLRDADSAHAAHCPGKISIDHLFTQSDRLENAGGLIGLESGNAHFGRYFDNAV